MTIDDGLRTSGASSIVCILFLMTGCTSSLHFYRGLSPNVSDRQDNDVFVYKGGRFDSRTSGKRGNEITLLYDHGPLISFEIDALRSSMVSFGPGLLLPLPIIPSPFGIWDALVRSSPDEFISDPITITITTNLGNTWDDGSFDPAAIVVSSDPAGVHVENEAHGELLAVPTRYRLKITEIPQNIRRLSVKLNNFKYNKKELEIPRVDFVRRRGIRLRWIPSING